MSRCVLALCLLVACVGGCSKSVDERRDDIYALKADPTPENVEEIRALLDDENPDVRATALHALIELNVPDARELANAGLADPGPFVRFTAAHWLEALADESAVPALGERVVEDEDPGVRRNAARALTAIGNEEAIDFLVTALEDPVKEVRLAAAGGIVRLDPEIATDTFVSMVLQDPEWEVRVKAAAALSMSSREDVVPILEEAANDPNELVRAAVAQALDKKKPDAAREE